MFYITAGTLLFMRRVNLSPGSNVTTSLHHIYHIIAWCCKLLLDCDDHIYYYCGVDGLGVVFLSIKWMMGNRPMHVAIN